MHCWINVSSVFIKREDYMNLRINTEHEDMVNLKYFAAVFLFITYIFMLMTDHVLSLGEFCFDYFGYLVIFN